MIKEYFVENLTSLSDVNVAKKENSYMFLSTPNFKFLDIKNFLAPGLSYDAWCRAYGCELQKLAFPYEWFDSFEKLNHIGPVKYEEFYSSLKGGITISQEEYQNFCDEFHKRGCVTMKDWLKEYNLADVEPFIEALEKTREQRSKIRSHIYREADAKTCRSVLGLDSNSLYLFCSGQEMPCGKEKVFKCNPDEQDEIIQNVLNDKIFGFF